MIVRGASVRRIPAAEFFRSRCAGFNTHLYVYAAGPPAIAIQGVLLQSSNGSGAHWVILSGRCLRA